jgi:hypothetical protein
MITERSVHARLLVGKERSKLRVSLEQPPPRLLERRVESEFVGKLGFEAAPISEGAVPFASERQLESERPRDEVPHAREANGSLERSQLFKNEASTFLISLRMQTFATVVGEPKQQVLIEARHFVGEREEADQEENFGIWQIPYMAGFKARSDVLTRHTPIARLTGLRASFATGRERSADQKCR